MSRLMYGGASALSNGSAVRAIIGEMGVRAFLLGAEAAGKIDPGDTRSQTTIEYPQVHRYALQVAVARRQTIAFTLATTGATYWTRMHTGGCVTGLNDTQARRAAECFLVGATWWSPNRNEPRAAREASQRELPESPLRGRHFPNEIGQR